MAPVRFVLQKNTHTHTQTQNTKHKNQTKHDQRYCTSEIRLTPCETTKSASEGSESRLTCFCQSTPFLLSSLPTRTRGNTSWAVAWGRKHGVRCGLETSRWSGPTQPPPVVVVDDDDDDDVGGATTRKTKLKQNARRMGGEACVLSGHSCVMLRLGVVVVCTEETVFDLYCCTFDRLSVRIVPTK